MWGPLEVSLSPLLNSLQTQFDNNLESIRYPLLDLMLKLFVVKYHCMLDKARDSIIDHDCYREIYIYIYKF